MDKLFKLIQFLGFKYQDKSHSEGYILHLGNISYFIGVPDDIHSENMLDISICDNFKYLEYDYTWDNTPEQINDCIEFIKDIKDFQPMIRKYKIHKLLNG